MMIPPATLSEEYRPGMLLSEFHRDWKTFYGPGKDQIHSVDAAKKYVDAYTEKLKSDAARLKYYTAEKVEARDYFIARLTKVGAKSFVPATNKLKEPNLATFSWESFKKEQSRSIKKLSTKISSVELQEKINRKSSKQSVLETRLWQESKFGVYQGWVWENDKQDHHKFYLVNNEHPSKTITVYYDPAKGYIDITTTKNNMKDYITLAIMLEIARNIQRYSNSNQKIKTLGLNDHSSDNLEIMGKIGEGIQALNMGVGKAKSPQDKHKKIELH